MRPSSQSLPDGFNPDAVEQWLASLGGLPEEDRLAWRIAVERYQHLCAIAGLFPFLKMNANSSVSRFLDRRRSSLVIFLTRNPLLRAGRILKIDRLVDIFPGGFSLTARFNMRITDSNFLAKLRETRPQRFSLARQNGSFVCQIAPNLKINVWNASGLSMSRYMISYTVHCPIVPEYDGDPVAFINHLWDSAIAKRRVLVRNRLPL